MPDTVVALGTLAVLIFAAQWTWSRAAAHADLRLVPVHSRRRVQWLIANRVYVYLAAVLLLAAAVSYGTADLLSR